MTNDLIFSLLRRENKLPVMREHRKVKGVYKDASARKLDEQEKPLTTEEQGTEIRQMKGDIAQTSQDKTPPDENSPDGMTHLDIYV
jgi:hypothetical protein